MNLAPRHKIVMLVAHFMAGSSQRDAAKAAGVAKQTALTWRRRWLAGEIEDIADDARAITLDADEVRQRATMGAERARFTMAIRPWLDRVRGEEREIDIAIADCGLAAFLGRPLSPDMFEDAR